MCPSLLTPSSNNEQGTTLKSLGYNTDDPLWGCYLVHTDPDAIKSVHHGYLKAGADLIETATWVYYPANDFKGLLIKVRYQMTLDLLKGKGHNAEEGSQIMRSAVHLASSAATAGSSSSSSATKAKTVLSLGSFGASYESGSEYTGIYPAPYDQPSTLEKYHMDRLNIFQQDTETWDQIEWLAFETVPIISEIRGIRHAMEGLQQEKKFWITSAYPNGRIGTGEVAMPEVVNALLSGQGRIPDGVGINCTRPTYLPTLIDEMTDAVRELALDASDRPWLVLYPNGGPTYDGATRQFSTGQVPPEEWAGGLAALVKGAEGMTDDHGERLWKGVIAGGCCNTGFDEIRALRLALDE